MALLPADLADDAWFEAASSTTAAADKTTTVATPTAIAIRLTIASPAIAGEIVVAEATSLGRYVGRGVVAAVAQIQALLVTHELCVEFGGRDGFDAVGNRSGHRVEVGIQSVEQVRDDLIISRRRPAAAISSAKDLILAEYSTTMDVPLVAFASAMRVVMILARDWEANMDSIFAHAPFAVTSVLTCPRISLERLVSR